MKPAHLTAIAIVVLLGLWMGSGMLRSDETETETDASAAETDEAHRLMHVQVREAASEPMVREVMLQGELEAVRQLHLRADTAGTIESLPLERGARVSTAELIATISMDGRDALLADAEASVLAARSEQQAARKLARQGLQSQVAAQSADAALAAAESRLDAVRRDIANTQVLAPYDGIINELPVEIGEQVDRGTLIASIVDDSGFIVRAFAPQQSLSELKLGQRVEARLITGEILSGELTFISPVADSASRSFEVEARVDNPGNTIAAGVSATLAVPVEQLDAVFISPSTLALGDDGELGVMTVDAEDTVQFTPIRLISSGLDGAWVSGIEAGTRIITLGQGFVGKGEKVRTTLESEADNAG